MTLPLSRVFRIPCGQAIQALGSFSDARLRAPMKEIGDPALELAD